MDTNIIYIKYLQFEDCVYTFAMEHIELTPSGFNCITPNDGSRCSSNKYIYLTRTYRRRAPRLQTNNVFIK